jgi:hypothetical protein
MSGPAKMTFTTEELEQVYRVTEPIAMAEYRRGAERIAMDWLSAEVRRLHKIGHSNTMRPRLAELLRERRPELRPLIHTAGVKRGKSKAKPAAISGPGLDEYCDLAAKAGWRVESINVRLDDGSLDVVPVEAVRPLLTSINGQAAR